MNNAGTVAFAALIPDPAANRSAYVVFRSAGGQLVALLNLTDSLGAGSPGPLVINDSGAIALHYGRGIEGMVVRIQADGAYVVLARADQLASTPYLEIAPTISMNGTGQVAALVTNSGPHVVHRAARHRRGGGDCAQLADDRQLQPARDQRRRSGRLHGAGRRHGVTCTSTPARVAR